MNKLLANWKTTSLGITTIAGTLIHLICAMKGHTDTEGVWNASVLGLVTGLGLIFAGDATGTPATTNTTTSTTPPTQPKP